MKANVIVTSLCTLAIAYGAPRAHADTHTCELVQADLVAVDGMLDDWRGIGGHEVGGKSQDASFSLHCAYDEARLYLAVRLFDNYIFRDKRPRETHDDNLVIALTVGGSRAAALQLFPGSDKVEPTKRWQGKAVPSWVEVEDTQQPRGWSMELAVPLARLSGLSKGTPSIDARIEYRDSDVSARVKATLTFSGRLEFQSATAVYKAFLKAAKLTAADVRMDELANVDDTPGVERVIAGGKVVGIVSDSFFYMNLPVKSARDVLEVKLADLRGDGTMSILTQHREYGNGGSRDVVSVWHIGGDGSFTRLLAFETRKELGGRIIVNRWSLAPRGTLRGGAAKRRGKAGSGNDLVIEVAEGDVQGWDEDSFQEAPAADVRPILTPWGEQTSAVYYVEGNVVLGGEPILPGVKRQPAKGRKPSRQ